MLRSCINSDTGVQADPVHGSISGGAETNLASDAAWSLLPRKFKELHEVFSSTLNCMYTYGFVISRDISMNRHLDIEVSMNDQDRF